MILSRVDAGVAHIGCSRGEFPKGSVSMRTRSSFIHYLRAGRTGEGGRAGGSGYEACTGISVWKHAKASGTAKCQANEAFSLNCGTQTQTVSIFHFGLNKKMQKLLSHAQTGCPALASIVR